MEWLPTLDAKQNRERAKLKAFLIEERRVRRPHVCYGVSFDGVWNIARPSIMTRSSEFVDFFAG